jgi:hypothetical protein
VSKSSGRRFAAIFLVWQLLLPLWQMAHHSERYDWAMFSLPRSLPSVEVRNDQGAITKLDLNALLGYGRGDVEVREDYWPQLCRLVRGVDAVRLTEPADQQAGTWHPCP